MTRIPSSPPPQVLCAVSAALLCFVCYPKLRAADGVPPCFSILSAGRRTCEQLRVELPATRAAPRLTPTAPEESAGLVAAHVPLRTQFRSDWCWAGQNPERRLSYLLARGEYRADCLGVHALRGLDEVTPAIGDLHGPSGARIPHSHVDVRTVHWFGYPLEGKGTTRVNRFLVRSFPLAVAAGRTRFLWVSVCAPPDARPGLYTGVLTLRAGPGVAVDVPLRVRVMDWDFAYPAGAWGTYLPGHLHRKSDGIYHNYAGTDWTAPNLVRMLEFWLSRGWNTPSLFHVYPDLKCIDRRTVADFPDVRRVANAMKATGMPGPLCIDTRHTMWWADAAARKLEALIREGKPTAGDIGVYGPSGHLRTSYGAEALRLYSEAVRQLLDTAAREEWPPVLLIPEEECSHPDKGKSYDACIGALQQVAGHRIILVDNVIGYGRPGELDRGHRDGVPVRQYNNWTPQGLTDARADGAAVWSYNLGWDRAAIWLYNQHIRSGGYHMWADHWLHPQTPLLWTQTLVEPDGIVTSVNAETFHEALCDLAYAQAVRKVANELERAGHTDAARSCRDVLAACTAGQSVQRYEFLAHAEGLSDDDLERRRWAICLSLQEGRALLRRTRTSADGAAPGTPRLCDAVSLRGEVRPKTARVVHAVLASAPVTVDGHDREPFWASAQRAAPLWWTASTERAMRARAGSLEEFRRQYPPSYAGARIAYDPDALYFLVNCNHATEKKSRCLHGDDDPDLWEDDCMEFFMQAPGDGQPVHQLIVNVRGRRVLKRSLRPQECTAVTATTSPVNDSGGYQQEVRVPWTDLGLAHPPEPGTVWRFNVCREFHSWGEQLTCWAQVEQGFGLADGLLVFGGPVGEFALRDLDLGHRFPGRNRIRGRAVAADNSGVACRVTLRNETGEVLVEADTDPKSGAFRLEVDVPPLSTQRAWSLTAAREGAPPVRMQVQLPACRQSVVIDTAPESVLGGARLRLDVSICCGDLSASEHPLRGVVQAADGVEHDLGRLAVRAGGRQRVSISTDGVAPGQAQVRLWLEGMPGLRPAEARTAVTSSPWCAAE